MSVEPVGSERSTRGGPERGAQKSHDRSLSSRPRRASTDPTQVMDNLSRLRALLRRALEHESGQGTQELYEALQLGSVALRRVGKLPEKSTAERKDIEAG